MSRRMKPNKVRMLVTLTVIVLASTLALTLCKNRIQAATVESIWVAPPVQEEAKRRATEVVPLVKNVLIESPEERRARLGDILKLEDMTAKYFLLESSLINKEEDLYGPVRFMHRKHAGMIRDCTECHHHRPADPKAEEALRCSSCHQTPFNPEIPERIGLKGALHRQCMGCHKKWNRGPVGCTDCHVKNVPDHTELVKLSEKPEPVEVTRECLRCHPDQGEQMLTSTHWLWRGPSPFTEGYEKRVDLGKGTKTVNNSTINVAGNWARCTECHAGYGWKDATFDFTDRTRIDCLVCHDTTGIYKKAPENAGMPDPEVDLVKVAKNVGKPSRKTCGECHFADPGDPVKHGTLNSFLHKHSKIRDIHMGGLDFQCRECHKTRNHKIAGRSVTLPVAEGSRSCSDCHTSAPHKGLSLLDHHLDRHSQHLACVTCHNPIYAKGMPARAFWDWSSAGDKKRKVTKDEHGLPDYSWKLGSFTWKENAKPAYAWYNGKVKRYLLGDKINTTGVTPLTKPAGDIKDPDSKIYPFKVMGGRQAADAMHNYLLAPQLFGPDGYWEAMDWQKAFTNGMEAAGLPYSGKYKWVKTVMYVSLNHEVMPKKFSLSCVQCHTSLRDEQPCARCHQIKRGVDFKKLAYQGIRFRMVHSKGQFIRDLVQSTDYIDFKKLGYKGDPIIYGGRFKQMPLGGHLATKDK